MALYRLIDLYKFTPSMLSLSVAAHYLQYTWLLNSNNQFVGDIDWALFKNLGLIEFRVSGDYSPKELLNISHNDQYPYLEFYLNESGTASIGINDLTTNKEFRVCFFLHFIDISKPLRIDVMEIPLPPMSDMPIRLAPFAHYVPVD